MRDTDREMPRLTKKTRQDYIDQAAAAFELDFRYIEDILKAGRTRRERYPGT